VFIPSTVETITTNNTAFSDTINLVTIVYVKLGENDFGNSPGKAVIMCTLRSETDEIMELFAEEAINLVKSISHNYELNVETSWLDSFSATKNDADICNLIEETAKELEFDVKILDKPFRPAEDFGIFTTQFKGAVFGIGAGENHPGLHNADYDFPEQLIESGVYMFWRLILKLIAACI